nr:CDP-glycerol glycerophosphotransferase family protein [Clostridium sp. 1001271B_151109_B4]
MKKIFLVTVKYAYNIFYKYIPVDERTIMFIAYHGRGYLCNPKYLHKYMINDSKYSDYKFIWAVKKVDNVNISNAKVIKYNGLIYYYYLARSKYWIINCKMPKHVLKKEEQIYLQTWHGTPLKRLAHDIEIGEGASFYRTKVSKREMTNSYDSDVRKYDYFISPNKFSTEKFKSAFKVNENIILESGYPRNDFLSNIKEDEINRLKIKYNIPLDKKVILYAPTWRDNSYNMKGYVFELNVDFNLWKKDLGKEYVVIFKPHYLIVNKESNESLEGFLYLINQDEDINELYVISDILVTDYSSVFFDYAILERPIYFYMYDLKEYEENLRGFYLNIYKDLPGKIITEEKQLLEMLKQNELYVESNKQIIKDFNKIYNNLQDGQCSKRVIESIIG